MEIKPIWYVLEFRDIELAIARVINYFKPHAAAYQPYSIFHIPYFIFRLSLPLRNKWLGVGVRLLFSDSTVLFSFVVNFSALLCN